MTLRYMTRLTYANTVEFGFKMEKKELLFLFLVVLVVAAAVLAYLLTGDDLRDELHGSESGKNMS